MPNYEATVAVQFDKATMGMTVAIMRDQVLANIGLIFHSSRSSLHSIPGIHLPDYPSYDVILSEHENHAIPLLQYQAAVICSDSDGLRIILHGKREATIWAAYRSLMRITMKEVAKRVGGGHVRTGSGVSDGSAISGGRDECWPSMCRDSGSGRGSFEREEGRGPKSMRVLGLEGMV
ncbi:hypothetical protein CAC42_4476 [Sphaceloma murrayae]|uniref:Uncharacterized protein n=1 Tax=Sphaceloma murrayae TaxID=2082308 RepID=A0A2K1QLP1_9PEZI|nr:hypothetical protein CAC42_4476 [Sphaceloma murrayae]